MPDRIGSRAPPRERFSAADAGRNVPVGVMGTAGIGRVAPPRLLADWREATVRARAYELAEAQAGPTVQRRIAAVEREIGRELLPFEMSDVVRPIVEPVARQLYTRLSASEASKDAAVSETLRDYRPIMAHARDPFLPIALGDPQARIGETILWESSKVVVLVDAFAPSPKALVVPKTPVFFPADASPSLMAEVAKVAAATSEAFTAAAGTGPAKMWINPPQNLSVRQMHAHVLPGLPSWPESQSPDGGELPAVTQAKRRLYGAVKRELAARLGAVSG